MLRDITLGQYYPVDSLLHRLDPRTKLFGTLVYIVTLFIADNLWAYLAATIFLITAIKLSNVPVKFMVRGLKSIMFLLLLSVSFNLKPGTYSVLKYSMNRENNIFAYMSALDFRDAVLERFYAPGNLLSGWPVLETYIEDVRTVLNVNFSIKGPGIQMAVIQTHGGRYSLRDAAEQ